MVLTQSITTNVTGKIVADNVDRLTQKRNAHKDRRAPAYVLWPTDQPDRQRMGGKAAALAALHGQFPIPAWFVITPAAFHASLTEAEQQLLATGKALPDLCLAPVVAAAVADALVTLAPDPQTRFAVRSSAVGEDGRHASFAGQLASYLQVTRGEFAERIVDVWRSAFSEHVVAYRHMVVQGAIDGDGADDRAPNDCTTWAPAVIVQRMVDADVAGVAFGADPVSGDRNLYTITAVRGLADQLVNGTVNGDNYRVDSQGNLLAQQTVASMPLLDPKTLHSIVHLLAAVETATGLPQDIEWALADGQLFLLQARPITTLDRPVSVNAQVTGKSKGKPNRIIWDNSNIVESYSGVTSPLTFSFARHIYEHVYVEFCKLMGVSPRKIDEQQNAFRNLLGYINGHVYYNLLNWYRILALFPGFQMNRRFMEQMMGVKEPLADELLDTVAPPQRSRLRRWVDGFKLARAGAGLLWGELTLSRTMKRFYQRLDSALTLTPEDMACLSLTQLVVEYRKVEQQLLTQWDAPLINDFLCMIAFGLSRKMLERHAGEAGLQLHSTLLIGQGDIISAEPAQRIRAMATLAATAETLVERLVHAPVEEAVYALKQLPELNAAYEAYLAKFGNRCLQELKLESATLHDDPTTLVRAIGHMARRLAAGTPAAEATTADLLSIDEALLPLFAAQPLRRWLTGRLVRWAKTRVRARENLRFERTQVFGYARQLFLAMGTRFVEAELLDDRRDLFLLTVEELLAVVDGTTTTYDLRGLIALRKAERARFNRLPTPPNRFTSDGLVVAVTGVLGNGPGECGRKQVSTRMDEERRGIGCCAGVVRAPVRVIKEPRGAVLLPGEIMVAQFTDPGWITLFANAAGILVERGSLLSHSAIVARELGIPAIVAVDGVMDWVQSGDVVELDGATGWVRKLPA